MSTGWRRSFSTTIPRDRETKVGDKQNHHHVKDFQTDSPCTRSSCIKLGFLSSSSGSNPSTPKLSNLSLRCRTSVQTPSSNDHSLISPKLHSNSTTTTSHKSSTKSPRTFFGSNPSSPRSPFYILKNSLSLSRDNNCGVCSKSVKTGQGMAIYTAECSHSFHFPCIAAHVRKQSSLVCPVCNSTWKDVPLLAIHKIQQSNHQDEEKRLESNTIVNKPEEINQPTSPFVSKLKTMTDLPQLQIKHSEYSRSYDDDEPLLSPVAGAKFNPIPEENEDEEVEDEIEEFQGFFVNPISSDDSSINSRCSRNVEVKLMPEAAVVSVGRTHETYAVVLKVKAPLTPSPPPQQAARNTGIAHFPDATLRASIDLVAVLDVSGSMIGPKLQMLKEATRLVISSLRSADRLSIVAFSTTPKRLMPLRRMTIPGQRLARRIVDRLVCGQGTSIAGEALRKATKILEDRLEKNSVASVILLSDGQGESVHENKANRRRLSTNASSTRFAHIEIPVHEFGFGYGDAFAKCVGGLLSVVARDVRIQLGVASGSDPVEISAVYSCNGRSTVLRAGSISLADLYAEEERELLLELKVPITHTGSHHVLSVRCSHRDPARTESIYVREQALLVPPAQAVRSSARKIERLKSYFVSTRAVAESRRLIEQNELNSAQGLLSSTRALLMQSGSADVHVGCLEAELEEIQMIQRRRIAEREVSLFMDENGEPLTPMSSWRVAEKLAKVAMMKKSLNRVGDLHGFENARF